MDRKQKRNDRRLKKAKAKREVNAARSTENDLPDTVEEKFAKHLSKNEDTLLNFVANINKLYQEKLGRPAPFMTYVICGMQSSGKSTIMERFMNAPLNIVQEGTGTRCPLDTTCIHDSSLTEPVCELYGKELEPSKCGDKLTVDQVFSAITGHNQKLASEDKFSTESLRLVYRAKNVQNMRFVDTPGIISNKGTGQDNREDIKRILRETMKKPNSKLCVLVEPKEFSTNPIIDFCDETFGGRTKWVDNSIVLMTKFDKQLEDSRSGSKANNFFKEFHENSIHPYLVITPTLPREDLPPEKLFEERKKLLQTATDHENERFEDWQLGHEKFRETSPDDPILSSDISSRIGFSVAKDKMREIMLMDTALRLPEVLRSIRKELADCQNELDKKNQEKKFRDPREVKLKVGQLLHLICKRINDYLDGDLETAAKYPDSLKDLDQELEAEEESEWCARKLGSNASPDDEENWRDLIGQLIDEERMPAHVGSDKHFLGGKQFQRAALLLSATMAEAIPDPSELRDYVASGAGYLQGGLQRENWERATLAIVKMSAKTTAHPGINFFIKHVGSIFRNLFQVALKDIKQGSAFSKTICLLPPGIENILISKFDDMVWALMETAADRTHVSLEPMYSSLNPRLPNFNLVAEDDEEETYTFCNKTNQYMKNPSKKESHQKGFSDMLWDRLHGFISMDGGKAKQILRDEGHKRANERKNFLPEDRTAMINESETEKIIFSAFQYSLALHVQIEIYLNFQINHYLYQGFKEKISTFSRDLLDDNVDWNAMIPKDDLDKSIEELNEKINGLEKSLREVQQIQAQF